MGGNMRLRNKKTGEIKDVDCITIFDRPEILGVSQSVAAYYTLAELNEEWEDAPDEPIDRDKINSIIDDLNRTDDLGMNVPNIRYRLKKDLPTFKAGEIFEIHDGNLYKVNETDEDTEFEVMAYHKQTLERFPNILTEWFEEIKPAEPLIEDEEIRRVIRCLGFEKIAFTQLGLTWRAYDANLAGGFELVIKTKPFDTCEDGGIYTIDELCGEEEE